jgi:hypothetical protein
MARLCDVARGPSPAGTAIALFQEMAAEREP